MFGMGPWELFLIFAVILLLFGAKRLPEMAQGLGKGIKEFRKAMKETTDEIKGSTDAADFVEKNDPKKNATQPRTGDSDKSHG
ncbi:twin-arginine translocase TatA/TatE family subunit [bacterium]|nr:twin-arginine translocase TatA/TatE family subunit [bacterium]